MIFIDGIGIGADDPVVNPFARVNSDLFILHKVEKDKGVYRIPSLPEGRTKSLDCTMGVEGLPQSATGQTALFTGINTANVLGRHLSGFPSLKLKQLLRSQSIMVLLERNGHKVVFANAFTPPYFQGKINRVSATTAMAQACNARIRNFEDLEKGEAVFMDLTNDWLVENGYWVSKRTVEEAAVVLAHVAKEHDFTLFEYFITDVVGHRSDMESAVEQVRIIEKLISLSWEQLDSDNDLLVVVSDHGNLEDISVRSHTSNRIPIIVAGRHAKPIIEKVEQLTDVTPALISEMFSLLETA